MREKVRIENEERESEEIRETVRREERDCEMRERERKRVG